MVKIWPWIWPKIETGLKFEVKYLTEFREKKLKIWGQIHSKVSDTGRILILIPSVGYRIMNEAGYPAIPNTNNLLYSLRINQRATDSCHYAAEKRRNLDFISYGAYNKW